MAELDSTYPTLLDLSMVYDEGRDAGQKTTPVVNMVAGMSPVARHGYVMPCNRGTRHQTQLIQSHPNPTWVAYYQRINPQKAVTDVVEDTTGRLKAMSSIDADLLRDHPDEQQYRMIQASAHLEGFATTIESTFFYGDTGTSPLEFLGLAPRMNDLSAVNGRQIIDAGGTSALGNTSMYICTWGANTGHLIVPDGMGAGVLRDDKGAQRDSNADGVIYYVEEEFQQHLGFSMSDWRYFARVCNIDVNNLDTGSAADLVRLIITAYHRLPQRKSAMGFASDSGQPITITPVIYCNSRIKEALHKQMLNQPNSLLRPGEFFGEEVMSCLGMPIIETDGIINTEPRVT